MLRKPFKKVIKGERITLRKMPYTMEQAEVGFSIIDNSRPHLLPWLQWVHYTKKACDYFEWLKEMEQDWIKKTDAHYGIYLNKTLIGSISCKDIDYNKDSCEIGYWIGIEFAGKGYTSEAVSILEDYFFNKGMNRIEIKPDIDNYASIAVAEKNDYTFEGVLRQNEFFREGGGEYRNTAVYSKLYTEWETLNG